MLMLSNINQGRRKLGKTGGGDILSLEKLGGRNFAIDLANHVFEGEMDKVYQKGGGAIGTPAP